MRNLMNRLVSRRLVLRGAGVALTLPWLESLLPTKSASAAAGTNPKRYIPIFHPERCFRKTGSPLRWASAQLGRCRPCSTPRPQPRPTSARSPRS